MRKPREIIPFFTDNDVDDDVGRLLEDSGHRVVRLRDEMLENSADPVVAAACRENGMVLVTHNVRHFRAIAKVHEVTKKEVDSLCRIELGCQQFEAVGRVAMELPIIELEWGRLGDTKNGLRIFIGDKVVRVHR